MGNNNRQWGRNLLWLFAGIVGLLLALGSWPNPIAALCLVTSGVTFTVGYLQWHRQPLSPRTVDDSTHLESVVAPPLSVPPSQSSLVEGEVRRDLVANVSHELKTPLTAIRGYAETLEDGALEQPEVARRFTGKILEQCDRLEALLSDLLTLSWLEGGEKSRKDQAVDLQALLHSTAELLAPRAEKRQIEYEFECEEGASQCLGAPDELERMLLNLLENAIKYNRQGGTVGLRLREADEWILLEIEDTGIGIPPDDLNRVFERFYRVDKGRSRGQGGTGLGLAIVKHVVREHGGRIEVKSRLGEGSCFRIWLPTTSE